jgi:hypothetical protein
LRHHLILPFSIEGVGAYPNSTYRVDFNGRALRGCATSSTAAPSIVFPEQSANKICFHCDVQIAGHHGLIGVAGPANVGPPPSEWLMTVCRPCNRAARQHLLIPSQDIPLRNLLLALDLQVSVRAACIAACPLDILK